MRVLRGVVYMTKSSGPRTEPWGTPQEEVCQEDRSKSDIVLFMIVYNYDADLEVSDTCVRSSLLS